MGQAFILFLSSEYIFNPLWVLCFYTLFDIEMIKYIYAKSVSTGFEIAYNYLVTDSQIQRTQTGLIAGVDKNVAINIHDVHISLWRVHSLTEACWK